MKKGQATSMSSGQVMLLTVLVIGGLLLGASSIAGLLMVYQLRQSSDITNSTKAIFAADSGIEWDLYQRYINNDNSEGTFVNPVSFSNNVSVKVTRSASSTKSIGDSQKSSRAFELTL